jgi:hypothetical protein
MMKPKLVTNSGAPTVVAVMAVLDRRMRELNARRDAITKEIIRVESSTGGRASDGGSVIKSQAEAMIDGGTYQIPPAYQRSVLEKLLTERKTIDVALKIGGSRLTELMFERAAEVFAEHFSEIAALEKERVLLALKLQHVNRARETLREKVRGAGGSPHLPTDSVDLLGLGDTHDETRWAMNRIVDDGIMTRLEIADMRDQDV